MVQRRNQESRKDSAMLTRFAALQILKEINQDGRYANISLKENLRIHSLSGRDAAFVTQLVYGTLENQITIDYYLGKLAALKRINPWTKNILRLGAYQILYLDRVPDSAACNEAVKLCKEHGLFALKGLVNGILRNLARSKEKMLQPDSNLSIAENLSIQYSYPLWLVKKWIRDFGQEMAETIMKPLKTENRVSIRVNTLKTTRDALKEKLLNCAMEVEDGLHLDNVLQISNMGDLDENLFYKEGYYMVQGESSILDSYILNPQPGEIILDACSAPGGKAIHMAELMKGNGLIHAWDVHPHRVELIERNRTRMGAEIVQPSVVDASAYNSKWTDRFDRVLVDAPCSGLGIIHKKPDIKLNVTPNVLQELPLLQEKILSVCSSYVKPCGVLVYSTCTINPAENQDIVSGFLSSHQEFYLEDIFSFVPQSLHSAVQNGQLQIIPSLHGIDGFFIARMRRRST
ncbi:MAG TPA: 16S rRNA (cytosine(967)-C(5))-methyltransferase RsmB [Clostridiales bacterium]|nr:16S rRNA (cytosine(967)-C(5))-methyltransferase RsmB [Clostridiales bacterium]